MPGVGLVPAPIEVLGRYPELNHQIAGQVFRLDLAALLAPEVDQSGLIATHDDPRVRTANEIPAVRLNFCPHIRSHEDFLTPRKSRLILSSGIPYYDHMIVNIS